MNKKSQFMYAIVDKWTCGIIVGLLIFLGLNFIMVVYDLIQMQYFDNFDSNALFNNFLPGIGIAFVGGIIAFFYYKNRKED